MQARTDAELLRQYACEGSEDAFREIVGRYTDVIYSIVLTQTGCAEVAEDVAQIVFTDLARKARSLAAGPAAKASLVGWIYRATRYAAAKQWRASQRRQARDTQAMPTSDDIAATPPAWEQLRPVLDEALAELDEDDRQAMLLRFFQDYGFRAIGAALGISEDAAQKRISRCLEKLRARLAEQGITTTSALLAGVLPHHTLAHAPAGMTAKLAALSLSCAKTSTTATLIAMTTSAKIGITVATVAAAIGLWMIARPHASATGSRSVTARSQAAARDLSTPEKLEQATIRSLQTIGTAWRLYASDHNGAFTRDFAELRQEYYKDVPVKEWDLPVEPGRFEFIDYGTRQLTQEWPQSILAREKAPRHMPGGAWHRTYLLADGSALEASSKDGKFDSWENEPDHRVGIP